MFSFIMSLDINIIVDNKKKLITTHPSFFLIEMEPGDMNLT